MGEPFTDPQPSLTNPPEDRLDSWKEIAAYLKRDVTTVQRWEKRERMPVHRHLHDKLGTVYAFRADLDAWARSRNLRVASDQEAAPVRPPTTCGASTSGTTQEPSDARRSVSGSLRAAPAMSIEPSRRTRWLIIAAGVVVAVGDHGLAAAVFRPLSARPACRGAI